MKSDLVYIGHTLDAIRKIERYLEGVDFEKLEKSELLQDAVVRELEIIGEASRYLSDDFKNENPQIPWRDIGDMRNKLIHEYFDVDIEVVWKTVQEDIVKLKEVLEVYRKDL